ncbi:nucleosome-remodeling factor subunit BPTF-like isoform X2 [Silurus meridionalis]|uniref:nucleosome-remodeling factor subunit BPTF-like isoform X2 n=1 Tax=Silurus meridionalis TaxID=175797 RepID=UPI001EEA8DC2|nr:nucleosome-remodeling factor subunit BPTF-like isoform X2 [Silurus meridionalis]
MRGRRGKPAARGLQPGKEAAVTPRGGRGARGRGRGRGRGKGLWTADCEGDENYQPPKRGRRRGSSLPRARGGRGSRGRRGAGGRGGRGKTLSKIIYDDHDSSYDEEDAVSLQYDDEEEEDDFLRRSEDDADYEAERDEEEEDLEDENESGGGDDGSDYVVGLPEEDDASGGGSTCGDTPGRKRTRVHRPLAPVFEEKDVPPLELPKSSDDILVPAMHVLTAASIYEVLRNFSTVLRLSPFHFEDFCAALSGQDQCTLLAETHVSLMKAILREEDTSNTSFGPADLKDSVNSTLYFMDGMTWPEVVRAYCESDPEFQHVLSIQNQDDFPYEPLESKLKVLQFLVDQYLATNVAREELMSEGVVTYDDHCRVCHHLGDLLCCETCSAVYHLECVKPPLLQVPEEEWQCEVCVAHQVPGVGDSIPESQKSRPYIRHEPIGFDRHRRKYWFLNRRIIVEEDGEHKNKMIWYYSTKVQLAELLDVLDETYWEKQLCTTLEELRDEIHTHMDITEELTNKARGNNKSYLTAANEDILERVRAKQEQEMEQLKRKAAEELQKSRREESQEQLSKTELMEPETPEDQSLQDQTGTEKNNPAASCDTKSPGASMSNIFQLSGPSETSPDLSASPELAKMADTSSSSGTNLEDGSLSPQTADENSRDDPDAAEKVSNQDEKSEMKEKGSSETSTGTHGMLAATRMVTRLRNPDSILSQRKSQQVAAALHESCKVFKDGKDVPAVSQQAEATRLISRSTKDPVMKGSFGSHFCLGQEGKYRVYQNQYSTNTLALNKHQHREDHDKRRHLSHKFCLTPAGEFKWNGSIFGSRMLTMCTLRLTIIQLENNIPAPFLHPNWDSHRANWSKAVQICNKAREFALALAILECAIKPVAMLPVWKDSLGHTRMHRMTSLEREEKEKVRKREKKLEEEETMQQATWVKYTFRIKHQVWKQKGEEYRVTGYGGWCWSSKTRVHRFVTRLPGNTKANYRQEMEAGTSVKNAAESNIAKSPEVSESSSGEEKGKRTDEDKEDDMKDKDMEVEAKAHGTQPDDGKGRGHAETDVAIVKQENEGPKPFFFDVVDVSEGFLLRTAYKKKVNSSKLDELLEHRVKQQSIEEKRKNSAICTNPKVVIQRLKFKMEPHGAVACIQPEGKSEVKKENTSTQERTKEGVLSLEPSVSQEAGTNGPTGECVGQVDPGGGHSTPCLIQSQFSVQNTTPLLSGDTHKQCVNTDNTSQSESVFPSTGGSSDPKFISTMNHQTSTETPVQVNNVTSLGENVDGYREKESKGSLLQMNGQDVKEPGTKDTLTNSVVNKVIDRRIEDDKKALSLKDPLKPLVNGSGDLERISITDSTRRNPEYLPPQKLPRLGVTAEDLPLFSPTIPKSDSALDSKEKNSMEASLNKDDGVSQTTIVPSPVLSAEESSLSNDFVESNCSKGSHTTLAVTQVTTTITTNTQSQTSSSGTANESNTVSPLITTTNTTVKQEPKTTTAPSTSESSSLICSKAVTRVQSTRERVQLVYVFRTKKARSETALPSYRKFVTKSCKKSIFVLPSEELRKLARKGGFREVSLFSYTAKPAPDIWPYPSPRPTFGITWRYRLQTVNSLAGMCLMLRLLWACLRWDDMAVKPSANAGTTRTETSETDITTTEIIKRRDVGPYGTRSEYCIRKIICPLGVPETPRETCTPQRKGLRSSALRPKRPEPGKQDGPIIIESWVPEEDLHLWEIRAFAERAEREKAQAAEQARVSARRKALELQQQKRQEQKEQKQQAAAASTPSAIPGTPSTPKTATGSLTSQVTPGTKVVLATKMGTPLTFQQNKNFQQTFATWVQGQVASSTVTTVSTTTGQTFQIAGSPVSVAGKVIPFPANSKIVTLSVPNMQGGVQQKVVGIIPSCTTGSQQTITTLQPNTTTVNITAKAQGTATQQVITTGGQLRTGMTVLRTPTQQGAALGKSILRTPIVVQQGQAGKVLTQIIQGQPGNQASGTQIRGTTTQTVASPRTTQGPIKLTLAQLTQLSQGTQKLQGAAVESQQGITVMVQGQGQQAGQLQVIPAGVTVIPTAGQQLMQAVLPNGQVQRFLFTPTPASTSTSGQTQPALKTCTPSPAQPVQAGAFAPRTPPMTNKAQMPIQSPTPLQAKATVNQISVKQEPVRPQVQLQQGAQVITVPGLQLPPEQTVKLQLPVQIQQQASAASQVDAKPQQVQNVVTLQTASVQEQLLRIQQLREQQQQKKRQQQEAKREQQQQAISQSDLIQKQVVMKQNAVIEQLKQKKFMTPAEREENQRMIVCNQVMKFILDKIDKDERQAAKKRKREETVEQKRSKQMAIKLSALLFKHKEQLKAEILKKRALLDRQLQLEVQEELRQDLEKICQERQQTEAAAQVTSTTSPSPYKRKYEEENAAKSKKKKMITTTSRETKKDTKLYCICKTPYDETKFYIGCDLCTNWYHGDCVGITEKEAKKMDDYICAECKQAQEGTTDELYCICRTPYDEAQFYIGCDRCQNWYHGRCVGILQSEATYIDEYVCPQCQSTEDAMTVLTPLTEKDYEGLRRILRSLQAHKMAWPFLEPVDPEDAPDYYRVIKEPMDLSTMEERLLKRHYSKLTEYVADMTRIFDNCRYYNPSDSPFYQCAEVLETFFVQKLKAFKASRSHNNRLQSTTS